MNKIMIECEHQGWGVVGCTSCKPPAALSGARLARCPRPAREKVTKLIQMDKKYSNPYTMVGAGEGGVSAWRQVGIRREVGSRSK